MAVNPAVPARSVKELVALSKAQPGTISYASPGVGSGLHLAGELFRQRSGADILHVAYTGFGPGLNDVLGGTVPMIIGNLPRGADAGRGRCARRRRNLMVRTACPQGHPRARGRTTRSRGQPHLRRTSRAGPA